MNPLMSSRRMAVIAMIAAVYTALVMVLPWLSYGPVQVRIAEALTILPVFTPIAVWGVGLGCFIANLVGWLTGANPLGAIDTIVGTAASVIAGIISYRLRHIRHWGLPILSALSPVVVNALIIGAQLSIIISGSLNPVVFAGYALSVGAGQMVACVGLGLPLFKALERTNLLADV